MSTLETWCEALFYILVFWAALRAKPDVFTCRNFANCFQDWCGLWPDRWNFMNRCYFWCLKSSFKVSEIEAWFSKVLHEFEKLVSWGVWKWLKVHLSLTLSMVMGWWGWRQPMPTLETWCEALSSILVFWAALRAKPDVLTYHVILQTVFKICVVFGLIDEILWKGAICMMSEVFL